MPSFMVELPSGRKFRVDDVESQDEAMEALRENGFLRGLRDTLDAPAQLLEQVVPEGVRTTLNKVNDWLVDQGIPMRRMGAEGLTPQLQAEERDYQALRPDEGIDWARLVGNVGGTVAAGLASGAAGLVPAGAGLMARTAVGMPVGAATSALTTPALEEAPFWQQKAQQAALGAAGGAVGELALGGLRSFGQHLSRPAVDEALERGIRPTLAQATGGRTSQFEEKLGSIPLIGDAIAQMRARAQDAWRLNAQQTAMEPLERVPGMPPPGITATGQEGVAQMQDAATRAYAHTAGLAPGGIRMDIPNARGHTAMDQIQSLQGLVRSGTRDTQQAFNSFLNDNLQPRLGGAAGFEARNFKELDHELDQAIAFAEGQAKNALIELRNILRGAAAAQNPTYAQALNATDTSYANLVRIENAVNRTAAREGEFTPGQLALAARQTDRSVRHRQAAAGRAPMQHIANLGQDVVGDRVADSGTPARIMAAAMAGGGLAAMPSLIPTALGAYGGARALYSDPAQLALLHLLRQGRRIPSGVGSLLGGASATPELMP